MTIPQEPSIDLSASSDERAEESRRKRLLLLLLLLLALLSCVGYFFIRYLLKPEPLPDMLPIAQAISYPPSYKFSIKGVDEPVGVALSPDGQRLYVSESAGDRLVKVFDPNGNLITSFAPAGTDKANREPKFLAVDASGRVFLVDRTSNAIHIFDTDGNPLDIIIGPQTTVSQLFVENGVPAGTSFHFEGINRILFYTLPGETEQKMIKVPKEEKDWTPLGIRFDPNGNLIYTDMTPGRHSIRIIPAADLANLSNFNPSIVVFGEQGKEPPQFDFPQIAVEDSKGNFYISDGNNYRISTWSADMQYRTFFGFGSGDSSLNLPRGIWIDGKDRLHVADAVGSFIRVYDVSGAEPRFVFNFGGFGISEGEFAYPIDVVIDKAGRLYIADRENNRIQVWTY